jgi:hypothetical protein
LFPSAEEEGTGVAHITFVHGSGNKPPMEILLDIWERSLARAGGLDLAGRGVTTSMMYWADVFYDLPLDDVLAYERATENRADPVGPVALAWEKGLDLEHKRWVGRLAAQLNVAIGVEEGVDAPQSPLEQKLEPIPLPWQVKRRLMKTMLRDVHHYLFNVTYSPRRGRIYRVREEIRQRMQAALAVGPTMPGPHIVVGHGMGTVIAYDCLKCCRGPAVDAFVTIGSPLGIGEIQDCMKPRWSRDDGFPNERVWRSWVNLYDALDPLVGSDPAFAHQYRKGGVQVVEDVEESHAGIWRHSISEYLGGPKLRSRLSALLDW